MADAVPGWALPFYGVELDGKKFRVDPDFTGVYTTVTISSAADPERYNFKALDATLSLGEYIASLIQPILDASHAGATTVATSYAGSSSKVGGAIFFGAVGHPTRWRLDFGTSVLLADEVFPAQWLGFQALGGPGANGIYESDTPATPAIVSEHQSARLWIAREETTRDLVWDRKVNSIGRPLIEQQNTVKDHWGINTFREVQVEHVEPALVHKDFLEIPGYLQNLVDESLEPILATDPNVTLQEFHDLLSQLQDSEDLIPKLYYLIDYPTTSGANPEAERERWVINFDDRLEDLELWTTELNDSPLLYQVTFWGWEIGE